MITDKKPADAPILAEDTTLKVPVVDSGAPVKAKRRSRFWKGLSIYAAVFLAIGAVALWFLYSFLANYEKGTANGALREYVAWVESGNFEAICEASGFEESPLNTKAEYIAYFEELYKDVDELAIHERLSLDGSKRYALYNGKTKLANLMVALDPSGEGNRWYVSTELTYQKPYKLIVSEDTRLTVNGADITTLSIPSREIQNEMFPTSENATITLPVIREYTLENLLNAPTVEAVALSGEACTVLTDEQTVYVLTPDTDAVHQTNEALAIEAATTYAKFVANDATRTQLLNYIHKESVLYQTIRKFSNAWFTRHESYEFRDIKVTEYVRYASTDFTCTVSFQPVYTRNGKPFEATPVHYRMTFLLADGNWTLYALSQTTAPAPESATTATTTTTTTTATTTATTVAP